MQSGLYLMNLDDVAIRIVKEDLLPAVHRPSAIIRKRDALFLEPLLEGLDVVRSKSDMASLQRVDGVSGPKGAVQVSFGQVQLHVPVRHEADLSRIPLRGHAGGVELRILLELEDVTVELSHGGNVARRQIDMVQFQFHRTQPRCCSCGWREL